ncbi:MAG: hypothetical protein IJA12_04780 [Oscillospiraceae bacterium]|nr:hypothetical protein [Oscillospiraceae bacterium]
MTEGDNRNILSISESREILSDIARSDESSSSEKMKAIDLLAKLPDDTAIDNEISVFVSYGKADDVHM